MQISVPSKAMPPQMHANSQSPALDDSALQQTSQGNASSSESQLQLRYLREYVGQCRSVLEDIRTDLYSLNKEPKDSGVFPETAARLCRFCMEADSRGFGNLYEVAFELQKTLLNPGCCSEGGCFWEAVHKSLSVLSALTEQCEIDFKKQLAVDDVVDSLRRVRAGR